MKRNRDIIDLTDDTPIVPIVPTYQLSNNNYRVIPSSLLNLGNLKMANASKTKISTSQQNQLNRLTILQSKSTLYPQSFPQLSNGSSSSSRKLPATIASTNANSKIATSSQNNNGQVEAISIIMISKLPKLFA